MGEGLLAAVLNPRTPQAQLIFQLLLGVCAFSSVILLIVTSATLYSLWRFRRRGEDSAPSRPQSKLWLEATWTLIPLLILVVTFIAAVRVMLRTDPVPGDQAQPIVIITGHQWWWEVNYPGSGIVTANEVHLPVGQPLLVELRAADVIHDFWVPELGRKMDAIPGHPNRLWLEASSPGTYSGSCAEFCGREHAWMRTRVVAQTQAAFAAWVITQKRLPSPESQISAGAHLFQSKSCPACHVAHAAVALEGVNAGPNLSHVGSRATLGSGTLENTRSTMIAWLKAPEQFKPQSFMPNLHLSEQEATLLADYLESLK